MLRVETCVDLRMLANLWLEKKKGNLKTFSENWIAMFSKPNKLWKLLLYVLYVMCDLLMLGSCWLSTLTSQDVYQRLEELFLWWCYVSGLLYITIVMQSHVFFDEFDMLVVIAFYILLCRIEVNGVTFLV